MENCKCTCQCRDKKNTNWCKKKEKECSKKNVWKKCKLTCNKC